MVRKTEDRIETYNTFNMESFSSTLFTSVIHSVCVCVRVLYQRSFDSCLHLRVRVWHRIRSIFHKWPFASCACTPACVHVCVCMCVFPCCDSVEIQADIPFSLQQHMPLSKTTGRLQRERKREGDGEGGGESKRRGRQLRETMWDGKWGRE